MKLLVRRLLTTGSLGFLTFPAHPGAQRPPRTLVALLAHADDESAASPVLTRYAREGACVFVVERG